MLAPQKRRRVARLAIVISESDDDVTHATSDSDNYEPTPLKRAKISKQKSAKRKASPVKEAKRKLPKSNEIASISSDEENNADLASEQKAKERKRVKATTTKASSKRTKATVPSSDGVDGATATKMGLFSSKSAKKKPESVDIQPKSKKVVATSSSSSIQPQSGNLVGTGRPWTVEQQLSNLQGIDRATSANIIRLFEEENTIPFICRYRRELTGNMDADRLRDIKVTYNHIKNVQSRAETILKDLSKKEVLTDEIRQEVVAAKSLDELDTLYAPYKTESKATLAERAKALGLEEVTLKLLSGVGDPPNLHDFVKKSVEGLESVEKVKEGIQHIIAQIFSKDIAVHETISEILAKPNNGISIQTRKSTSSASAKAKQSTNRGHGKTEDNESKFEIYFQNELYMNRIKSHQWLAICRGENLKYLTVKVVIPQHVQFEIYKCIRKKFFDGGQRSKERLDLLNTALDLAWSKKLVPLMTRQIRSSLTKEAEKASIDVFAQNLKQLLLLHPIKGKKILGIDPGFSNGCKIALISERNDVLETAVIYPHTHRAKSNSAQYGKQIADLMAKHKCDLIALGNGTACRETESWLTDLMRIKVLDEKSIKYCIVSECGASIYSCSDEAKNEFPKLDVNLISAVSIARRLSDPLAELVKIDAKHLGVGMYQHDVNEKLLTESLNEVVMECVSFVGVDLNTSSVTLLRHVAGLSASRAENIIKYRSENGPFKSRGELLKVKSIGPVTFLQCAGFVRIEPLTANLPKNSHKYCILDSTWVHPESYDVAKRIINNIGSSMQEVGTPSFIAKLTNYTDKYKGNMNELSREYGLPEERLQGIFEALGRELNRDYRDDTDVQPLFKSGLQKMADLAPGTILTGAISNITPFGCFVDIGVEKNGLIHSSKLGGATPKVGDRVSVEVMNVEIDRQRIQLRLVDILK